MYTTLCLLVNHCLWIIIVKIQCQKVMVMVTLPLMFDTLYLDLHSFVSTLMKFWSFYSDLTYRPISKNKTFSIASHILLCLVSDQHEKLSNYIKIDSDLTFQNTLWVVKILSVSLQLTLFNRIMIFSCFPDMSLVVQHLPTPLLVYYFKYC